MSKGQQTPRSCSGRVCEWQIRVLDPLCLDGQEGHGLVMRSKQPRDRFILEAWLDR